MDHELKNGFPLPEEIPMVRFNIKKWLVSWVAFLAALLTGLPAFGAASSLALEGKWITDHGGKRIRIDAPFKRIISLYGAHTENLFALGGAEAVIGVGRNDRYPPQARLKPVFHYREDAEKFLAARPDLVLIRPMIAGASPQLIPRLEAAGITVVSLQPGNVDEMFRYWRILGALTGREEQAEAMVAQFQAKVAAYRLLTASVTPRKKVFFEAVHAKMKTFAPDAMALFALECAGGINVAEEATSVRGSNIADFGKERVLALGNDIDVYLAQVGPMNRPTLETIREEPGFQAVRAVRTGAIHLIDETLVSRPTMRLVEGIAAIGAILYPDRFGSEAVDVSPTTAGNGDAP